MNSHIVEAVCIYFLILLLFIIFSAKQGKCTDRQRGFVFSCSFRLTSVTNKCLNVDMLVPSSARVNWSNVGMVFLKALNANIGFILLLKPWGLVPPGEWNVINILNNVQIAFAIIHFRDIFSLFYIPHIQIFWSVILLRFTHACYMLWYNLSIQRPTFVVV